MKKVEFELDDTGFSTALETQLIGVLEYVEAVIFDHKTIFAGGEPKKHLTDEEKNDLKILLRSMLKDANTVITDRMFEASGVDTTELPSKH